MQRILMAALPLFLFAASGCDFFQHKEKFYTYCDSTGCYTCDQNGCSNSVGVPTGSQCGANAQCASGCYCDAATGTCVEGGFCSGDADCTGGMTCDTTRHSCQPGATGGNGTTCSTNSDCQPGDFCHPTTKQCVPSWSCSTDADCGAGMVCDSRHTCVPGPTTCTTSSDCATGCYCANGTCNETGVCKMDSDCTHLGANYSCVNNTCVPGTGGQTCKLDKDCAAGMTCVNGTCQNPTNPTGCTTNDECGQGEIGRASCRERV